MGKLKLVISDFHIADGQRPGEINPFEGFFHDDKFAQFLSHYSSDYYEDEDVELIINGDFFDLLTVRYQGEFPDCITEEIATTKVRYCLEGHPKVVTALRSFLEKPNKRITYLPGNHDFDIVFPRAQREFTRALCDSDTSPLIRFITDRDHYRFDGIEIHHGQQWEAINTFNFKKLFITERGKEPVLNLPWGSLFVLRVLNRYKEKRPYIDRIQPFNLYLLGALVFDTWFALNLIWSLGWEFVRLRFIEGRQRNAKFNTTLKIIWEFSAFPNFENRARRMLAARPGVHTLLAGHTHLAKVRVFGPDKVYINTGTWTDLISLDMSRPGRASNHYFVLIEYPDDAAPEGDEDSAAGQPPASVSSQRPDVHLKEWMGYHELTRDISV